MIECRQDLALSAKTAEDKVGIHATLDELDRHALVEFLIDSYCFINGAHAAAANFAFESIGAKTPPDHGIAYVVLRPSECLKRAQGSQFGFTVRWLLEKVAGTLMLRQQGFDIAF